MARFALKDAFGIVRNVIVWDGATAYLPSSGLSIVSDPGNQAQIGYASNGTSFTPLPTTAPAQAAAVGYVTQTLGPSLNLGANWFPFNFFGQTPVVGQAVQAGSGVLLPGVSGDSFGATIATAKQTTGNGWTGTAFGGGFYIEALLSFIPPYRQLAGWPSFWSEDIENMSFGFAAEGETNPTQWQGQPVGFNNWIELDFMEASYATTPGFACTIHNWYGTLPASNSNALQLWGNGSTQTSAKLNMSQPNRYGCLWVPATATVPGYVKWFFNETLIDQTSTWTQYNAASAPPPVAGSSGFSVIDSRHMAPILGTNTDCPMQVFGVTVWQQSSANNITQ